MYIEDLSLDWGKAERVLSVGWLSIDHEFPTGSVPGEAFKKLLRLAENPVNKMRGWHDCEFCLAGDQNFVAPATGNGEIRVRHKGVTYAAPVMVLHYIEEHGYRPPREFIEALMRKSKA